MQPAISHYQSSANRFVKLITTENSRSTDIEAELKNFVDEDRKLEAALLSAIEHQKNVLKIRELQRQLHAVDEKWDSHLLKLHGIHDKWSRESREDAKKRSILKNDVNLSEAIKYAGRIAKFSSAPSGYSDPQGSRAAAQLPWPSEDILRQVQFGNSDEDAKEVDTNSIVVDTNLQKTFGYGNKDDRDEQISSPTRKDVS